MDHVLDESLATGLRSAASAADGHLAFHRAADELLRPALGHGLAGWATTDPASLVHTSCVTPGVAHDPEREARLFESEYGRRDVNHFADLAAARVPAASLQAVTGGEPERSWRHRHLLAPAGVSDELRLACVDEAGCCWATVALYRQDGAPFSTAAVELAAELGPVLARCVRWTLLRQAAERPGALDEPPGMLWLRDGEVTATTEPAERWLDRLGAARLHSAVLAVAADAVDGPSRARVAAGGDAGWVALHASPVKGEDDTVAVIVERLPAVALSEVIVAALGLTAREREVVEQVLAGRSTRQAARALAISPWTVQDHLKAVFAKAGVASRGELAALLHYDHYQPRVARGVPPGPYGWFLEQRQG